MPFKFLKYIQPTHYFALKSKGLFIYPIASQLPESISQKLQVDDRYSEDTSRAYDLSWQAIQLGYIGKSDTYKEFDELPLVDNYRFIRKYFNAVWTFYILGLRLLSLKNPVANVSAFMKSRNMKRSKYLDNPIEYQSWEGFDSKLVAEKPLISVVIPTLNRYQYLKDVLQDLEKQSYENFEVIIVDQSQPFNKTFYNDFDLDLKLEYQEEKALWLARNSAIKMSKGDYILLFDDDSRVEPDWIHNHIKCLDFFNADISSGTSISIVGNKVPQNYSFFRISDQLDTGNVLIKKSVFNTIGLFDRQFEKQRMGDGEYGLRAHINGYLNISNPFANRLHLKVGVGGLRQMGSWDSFRTKRLLDPRPIPSVLYLFRRYYGKERSKLSLLKTVPTSIFPYQFKRNKVLTVIGGLITVLILPVIFFQVGKSWIHATKKINEGPLIEPLEI